MGVQTGTAVGYYLDDSELSVPVISSVCAHCQRLRRNGVSRACDAFPDGIPMPIWLGESTHQQAYSGDHGIQFEPVDTPFLRQKFPQYFEERRGVA